MDYFFIRKGNIFFKVKPADIDWINSEKNYCTVVANGKKYPLKTSLRKIAEQLPEKEFLQIHKSYIARLENIESIDIVANKVVINSASLPLGRSFKSKLLERLKFLK